MFAIHFNLAPAHSGLHQTGGPDDVDWGDESGKSVLAKKPHHQGLFLRGQIRKRRAARAKAKAKQAQNKERKVETKQTEQIQKKNKKKEQKKNSTNKKLSRP